jgi:hypothetical protein
MEEIEEIDFSAGYAPQLQVEDYQGPAELWSEILPGLWQGGTADSDIISSPKRLRNLIEREEFDAVVTCYSYDQPMSWYVHENRFGFADGACADERRL